MRVRSLALWAALGVVSTSAAAFAIPVPSLGQASSIHLDPASTVGTSQDIAHFTAGQTLTVDARLGHASMRRVGAGTQGETFVFASVTGADAAQSAPALDLALVIDRSGSMMGRKIANAIAAAVGSIDRMRDGDVVSVVSFDTSATVVVPPTPVTASTRASIASAIRGIRLGGDTCISCGIEEGMRQLELGAASVSGHDHVSRIVLLSDGEATHGIKDVPGVRAMASRMRDRGVTISTIGVDTNFDEQFMSAIAVESNGRHYFVADPSGLPAIYNEEFQSLEASLAQNAELVVDPAPGVVVEEVFDRSFRREGGRVVVPFGTFSAREEKTVLLRVRAPVDREGVQPVASLRLAYRDLVARTDGTCAGSLAFVVKSDGSEQPAMDPFVAARLARSHTAAALTTANSLFKAGNVDGARAALAQQQAQLKKDESSAFSAAPAAPAKARGRNLSDDFKEQADLIAKAQAGFSAPATAAGAPPAPPPAPANEAGRKAVRANQSAATDVAF
jgi:Ca-activated chloride channel family protein